MSKEKEQETEQESGKGFRRRRGGEKRMPEVEANRGIEQRSKNSRKVLGLEYKYSKKPTRIGSDMSKVEKEQETEQGSGKGCRRRRGGKKRMPRVETTRGMEQRTKNSRKDLDRNIKRAERRRELDLSKEKDAGGRKAEGWRNGLKSREKDLDWIIKQQEVDENWIRYVEGGK
eukprot:gb/GEZN01010743.1/.p2 GENE.gb/GEZN01010743.1/~~gb/GEZN01010743.1/.p2  ORF type:complete len:173 (+),score=16.61 gb/GEZN01010743.1/:582-1100(+)